MEQSKPAAEKELEEEAMLALSGAYFFTKDAQKIKQYIELLKKKVSLERVTIPTLMRLKNKSFIEGASHILAMLREEYPESILKGESFEALTQRVFDDYKKLKQQ